MYRFGEKEHGMVGSVGRFGIYTYIYIYRRRYRVFFLSPSIVVETVRAGRRKREAC